MGFFGGKKREVVDLSERYKRQQARIAERKTEIQNQEQTSSGFGFFGNFNKDTSNSIPAVSSGSSQESGLSEEEKRRRLAKRFLDITNRLEDLSNQIYHLQQRVELLEKKVGVKSSEVI